MPFGNGTLCLKHYRESLGRTLPGVERFDDAQARRARLAALPGYEQLAEVLDAALAQAQAGKGKERHALEGVPFHEQPIVEINAMIGTPHGALYQLAKKAQEAARLEPAAAERELLGAINYAAAAILVIRRLNGEP